MPDDPGRFVPKTGLTLAAQCEWDTIKKRRLLVTWNTLGTRLKISCASSGRRYSSIPNARFQDCLKPPAPGIPVRSLEVFSSEHSKNEPLVDIGNHLDTACQLSKVPQRPIPTEHPIWTRTTNHIIGWQSASSQPLLS